MCSVQSPVALEEETKGTQIVSISRRQQVGPARFVPMIRNHNKIAKPPRKAGCKKEVETVVQSRKAFRRPARKQKGPQTDFTQKQERSDVPHK